MRASLRPLALLGALFLLACPVPVEPLPDPVPPEGPGAVDAGGEGQVDAGVAARARLEVLSPVTGTVSFDPALTLEVRVRDGDADGLRVQVDEATPLLIEEGLAQDATRSIPLTLALGVNRIHLELLSGGEKVDDAVVVVFIQETTVPLLEVLSPLMGETTLRSRVEVAGRIVSSRPITQASVTPAGGQAEALNLAPAVGGFTFTGSVALNVGENTLRFEVADERGGAAAHTVTVQRAQDTAAPALAVTFPREGQAVRTRQVQMRGTTSDDAGAASVKVALGTQQVAATVAADGTWTALLMLAPAMNEVTVTATDDAGNAVQTTRQIYFGQRLASGGAHGGAVTSQGGIATWGRNNLGQTGLDYVSHESRAAWCDRTLTSTGDITLCKATTLTAIHAVCDNPSFLVPKPPDSPDAQACRSAVTNLRAQVCAAAGVGAPNNCATSASANLFAACDAAYGTGTSAGAACKQGLLCDPAYPAGSPAHAHCVSLVDGVPLTFPAPATPHSPTAVSVPGTTFVSLAFNQNASSALDAAGRIWSWGDNGSGQLCLGDTNGRIAPAQVADFGAADTQVVAIARGYEHLLALRSDGTVWSCGANAIGQLGDGTSGSANNRSAPTPVQGLPANVVQVSAGSATSYALTADGVVWAWGRNQYGNLGNGQASAASAAHPLPAQVPGLTEVVMIANGRDHVLAAKRDGTLWAWGLNASNQVDGSGGNVLSPVRIQTITDARAVYANGNQGFYEDAQGRLFGWGQNGSGNLGIPENADQPVPTLPVFGIQDVLDVGIGALQGFAMRGNQVFAWGWSFHGSLGAGTSAIHTWPYRTPILVQMP
ncbi:hypothetical protein [Myxococcus sp. SDU36]|uniref:hypothetical protein n=1 Tax=Myxococcus sp. SDU36 TaxID=2831967 RepID=UPI002543BDC4|nr:hypothetical protein [Myxococcus sp. SDU36]WIG98842.1 hypothetical protein KGD87_16450 [Myxococcus sp. SDU36]